MQIESISAQGTEWAISLIFDPGTLALPMATKAPVQASEVTGAEQHRAAQKHSITAKRVAV
jgi:hypothetical protein